MFTHKCVIFLPVVNTKHTSKECIQDLNTRGIKQVKPKPHHNIVCLCWLKMVMDLFLYNNNNNKKHAYIQQQKKHTYITYRLFMTSTSALQRRDFICFYCSYILGQRFFLYVNTLLLSEFNIMRMCVCLILDE